MKTTIGIDNGPTGTIGIIGPDGSIFEETPTQPCLHYGKKGTKTQRLDRGKLWNMLTHLENSTRQIIAYLERPFTGRFPAANISAARFFEATIITLEDFQIGYEVIDSKVWQLPLLGKVKGSAALKQASLLRGIQIYPHHEKAIRDHGDADGILIAHFFHSTGR
ncbi:MAG: RuvC family protein [Planctomycetota bacterium]|jgi:hypothetical protein